MQTLYFLFSLYKSGHQILTVSIPRQLLGPSSVPRTLVCNLVRELVARYCSDLFTGSHLASLECEPLGGQGAWLTIHPVCRRARQVLSIL